MLLLTKTIKNIFVKCYEAEIKNKDYINNFEKNNKLKY